jgi:hypothetical protein
MDDLMILMQMFQYFTIYFDILANFLIRLTEIYSIVLSYSYLFSFIIIIII